MEVKKKNQKLIILVGVLLLFVGGTFAYFISKVLNNGAGGSTSATTAVINGATVRVEGIIEFDDLDILPGHKSVSGIKVTATGNNELIPYNLIWSGTNTLTTPLNFTVYKTSEQIEVTSSCSKKTKIISGVKQLSEECTISNLEKLGTEISSGTINQNDTKVTLSKDEFITATSTGDIKYYYIILEYPNLDKPQNEDLTGEISGKVTVEESNTKPDINIIAAYIEQDDGEYKQVEDIPSGGYIINTEKSTCSNGATPTGITPNITINNLTKSGTSCYLYFDKTLTIDDIIAANNPKSTTPNFANTATTDEGVFAVSDGMYRGTSYYWRGAATTNYVKFAGFCWRIVRINGDKSIRLIYDGTTCHANGQSTTDSLAVTSQAYNASSNRSEYVGYTYSIDSQRAKSGTESNLKSQIDTWYNNYLTSYADKIADGKYCNDRNVASGYSWGSQPISAFSYAGMDRRNGSPTLSCPLDDIYTLKAGAITVDEVIMAGGKWAAANSSYYLYNGNYYWTMSPGFWSTSDATVFLVWDDGQFVGNNVNNIVNRSWGVRPIINLKANIQMQSGGNGTLDNPYIVAD